MYLLQYLGTILTALTSLGNNNHYESGSTNSHQSVQTGEIKKSEICSAINEIYTGKAQSSFARIMSEQDAEKLNLAFQEADSEKYYGFIQDKGGNKGNPYLRPDSAQIEIKPFQADNSLLEEAFPNSELPAEVISLIRKIRYELFSCPEVVAITKSDVFFEHFATKLNDNHKDYLDENEMRPKIRATFSFAGAGTIFPYQDPHTNEWSNGYTPSGSVAFFNQATCIHARPQPTKGEKRVNTLIDVGLKTPSELQRQEDLCFKR